MAGEKISALPPVSSVLGTDIYPAVQAGITVGETINQLTTFMNSNVVLASIAQVTGLNTALAGFLPLSGGTLSGPLNMGTNNIINLANPVNPQDAATKAYVQMFASGITVILAAAAATTANLNATSAGAGIGATLTNAGTQAAFVVDGYTASVNDRILVKNQTLSQHNGVYVVTNVGSVSTNWVLTRSTDYDTTAQIVPGTLVPVNNGTVNASTSWIETATVTTVDTSPILFSQFTFAPTAFLQIANNLSDVASVSASRTNLGLTGAATMALPVSLANGGTGQSLSSINNGVFSTSAGGASQISTTLPASLTIPQPKIITGLYDANGNLILDLVPEASAVNYLYIENSATGQPLVIGAAGTDTNIQVLLAGQGNAGVAVQGNSSGSNASGGYVGEFTSSVIATASAVALVSSTPKNVTSISLSAGDWDVWGNVGFTLSATGFSNYTGWISSSSASLPDGSLVATEIVLASASASLKFCVPQLRFSLSSPTTIFLSVDSTFIGTVSAFGGIYARRRR